MYLRAVPDPGSSDALWERQKSGESTKRGCGDFTCRKFAPNLTRDTAHLHGMTGELLIDGIKTMEDQIKIFSTKTSMASK
jgi:hypothetical protein